MKYKSVYFIFNPQLSKAAVECFVEFIPFIHSFFFFLSFIQKILDVSYLFHCASFWDCVSHMP